MNRFLANANGGNCQRFILFENINQLMYRANALDALDSKDPKGEAHCRERNSCMHLSAELQRIAQCIECQFRTAANYEEFHVLTKSRSEPAQYEGTFDGFRVTLCPFFFAAQKGEKLTPYQQCQQYVLLKLSLIHI